ncbi:MAG TPA: ferritin-like domain-containing protein [Bdellovibrionales bacterium]|nr:ferritin-like domain-containing protein [Bdellovibrionales bacterium]
METTHEPQTRTKVQRSPERNAEGRNLSPEKRLGWAGLLSSIATSESAEQLVVEPLVENFGADPELKELIERQAADEVRHYRIFTSYNERVFQFRKTKRTLTDKIVYDRFLPLMSAVGRRRPQAILLILQFYESFSIEIYKELKRLAQNDRLYELAEIIDETERDEWRHLAGLKRISKATRKGSVTQFDRWLARLITLVLRFDVHAGPWALHNKKLRKNLERIGFDPAIMVRAAAFASARTHEFARKG